MEICHRTVCVGLLVKHKQLNKLTKCRFMLNHSFGQQKQNPETDVSLQSTLLYTVIV